MDGDSEQTKRLCFTMCQQYFGKAWKATPFYENLVKKVSGGLSNYLFVCSLPDDVLVNSLDEPRQVLVRFYGLASGDPVAVLQDSLVFALLSEKGLGPKFYGFFSGGRFEQYIPSRCLKTAELAVPKLSQNIAQKTAHLHLLDMPLCKEPKMLKERMTRWLKAALSSSGASFKENARKDALWKHMMTAVDLEAELCLLLRILDTAGLPIVFCHNDLQEGNILIADGNPDLVLIDFEYAAYNFRGFDLANHFCEWCYDYTNDKPPYFKADLTSYPSTEQQAFFIKHYLRALLAGQQPSSGSSGDDGSFGSPSVEPEVIAITDKLLDERVVGVMRETDVCILASHFHWMLWALVSATTSQVEFGYLEYAQARLDGYYASKENLLKKYPDIRDRLLGEAAKAPNLTFHARSRSASEEERQEG